MNTSITENITSLLDWRYATKKFSEKKITDDDWAILEQSLIKAPSSYGLQPWHFTVVTDPALKERLEPAAFGQAQITSCSHLVVLSARRNMDNDYIAEFVDALADNNNVPRDQFAVYEQGMSDHLVNNEHMTAERQLSWAQRQVYIPLGFLLMAAASLGIDACPMEGFSPDDFDGILGQNNGEFTATAIVALGYRSEEDDFQHMKKTRFTRESVLTMR